MNGIEADGAYSQNMITSTKLFQMVIWKLRGKKYNKMKKEESNTRQRWYVGNS